MRTHFHTLVSTPFALAALLLALAVPGLPGVAAAQAPASAPAAKPAAAAPASLDAILRQVATYDGGIESSDLWKLRDYVQARKDDPAGRKECETKLLAFLKSPATAPAKMAAAKHLRLIADETAVPALQALLRDARTSDYGLYVLRAIPGPGSDKALVQALGTTTGPTRLAVISALGDRQTADAVPALTALLTQPPLARAAATALGRIGTEAAGDAIVAAYPRMAAGIKPAVAACILQCAERALAGKGAAAKRFYDAVAADASLPPAVRLAAAIGRIDATPSDAPAMVVKGLADQDAVVQQAAVARVKRFVLPGDISQVCTLLPRLPVRTQVQVLAVLSTYPAEGVRPAILQAARSESQPVRLAAFKALEATGDASVVAFAAEAAAKSRGAEQAAARATLGALKGRAVDEAILSQLAAQPPEEVRGEFLLAVADRRIFSAKAPVAAAIASSSPRLRVQGLKALRVIGTPSDVPGVLDLVVNTGDDVERAEAEATVVALAQKTLKANAKASMLKTRYADEKAPQARGRLLALFPQVGDDSALPILRAALADENADVRDAAVRAVTAWPTAGARDDVFRLARDSRNETHRLLAIGALVRLVGVDRHRDPQAAVADLRAAAAFSWRPEEHRLVLGALEQFACADALDLAKSYASEAPVKAEAEAAVTKINERLKERK